MPRIAHMLAIILLPVVLAACQAGEEAPYARVWGGEPGQAYVAEAIPSAGIVREFETAPDPLAESAAADRVLRTRLGRDAHLHALSASRSRLSRTGGLGWQEDHLRYAERARDRAARALDAARREHRSARWRDLSPVRTGPFDRADAERRDAASAERLAASAARRAAHTAERADARLGMMARAQSAQDRIDLLDRVRERHEARQRLVLTRSAADAEIRRLLPYRRPGEQIEDFRNRIRRAQDSAVRRSTPIETILRGGTSR